jgi:hypothetical protein
MGAGRLEPAPGVRSEGDRPAIEAYVIELQPEHLGLPAPREQISGDEWVCEHRLIDWRGSILAGE